MFKKLVENLVLFYGFLWSLVLSLFDKVYRAVYVVAGYKSLAYAITMTIVSMFLIQISLSVLFVGAYFGNFYGWLLVIPVTLTGLTLTYKGLGDVRDLYVLQNRGETLLKEGKKD